MLATVLIAACARVSSRPPANVSPTPHADTNAADEVERHNGATILSGDLLRQDNRPLLDAMRRYLPGMEIVENADCPEVHLRGRSTITTRSDPAIYVNGERAANTCVLAMLPTSDIARVEIYASGIPPAGTMTSPYGVILIFSRRVEP
jgi:predicted TIM-barrel fold metal-dependent hydrolase